MTPAARARSGRRWQKAGPPIASASLTSRRSDAWPGGLDWPRTLVARRAERLSPEHLRWRRPETAPQRLHCFVLDVSASMQRGGRLARAKGLLLALLDEAYRRREQVALLCFSAGRVELRIAPGRAARWNESLLGPIAGGGGTLVAPALAQASALMSRAGQGAERWLWLLTDGRFDERPARPHAQRLCIVDLEDARVPLRRASRLAQAWDAHYLHVDDISEV